MRGFVKNSQDQIAKRHRLLSLALHYFSAFPVMPVPLRFTDCKSVLNIICTYSTFCAIK